MLKHIASVGLIAAVLAAPPVLAQTTGGQTPADQSTTNKMAPATPTTPPANTPDTNKPAAGSSASATPAKDNPTFVTQQDMDQWRASKLVGVSVYGPDQKKVGSIKDILMDHDGNAKVVVVSVGGFLGIGSKDVAVPFKAMQWQTEGRAAATTNPPPASTNGTGNGAASNQAAASKTSPAEVEASQGYPDRGVLAMTEEQLKQAPDFHYASEKTSASTAKP